MFLNELLYLVEIVVVIIFALFIGFSVYIYRNHCRYSHLPGPKRTSFFFGNLAEYNKGFKEGSNSLDIWLKWYREYGSIYVVHFIHHALVPVVEPMAIKDLFVTSDHPKSEMVYSQVSYIYGVSFFGKGLVTELNHQKWQKTRRLLNPAFKRRYLNGLLDQYNECADTFVNRLDSLADGKTTVVMAKEFRKITLDVIVKLGFNLDAQYTTNPYLPFPLALETALKGMDISISNPLTQYNIFEREFQKRVQNACHLIRNMEKKCILQRLADNENGEEAPPDILSHILQASNDLKDPEFQMKEILDNFTTFILAGFETTSNTLSFLILELCRNPDVMKKLRSEIFNVVGDRQNLKIEDFVKLKYMTQVFYETLRKYPVNPAIARTLAHDVVYVGTSPDNSKHEYRLPAGTDCSVSYYALSRAEKYFPEPEKFDPERFSENPPHPIQPFTFIPFSAGSRTCIGRDFAMYEVKVVMTKLLQNFEFELLADQTFDLSSLSFVCLRDGCKTYVKRKNPKNCVD